MTSKSYLESRCLNQQHSRECSISWF